MRDLEIQLGGHEKFLELCALYTTGSLTDSELAVLRQHLETCASCRTLLADYRQLNRNVIPLLADERIEDAGPAGWMQEEAKRRLFETLDHSSKETLGGETEVPGFRSDPFASGLGIFSRLPGSSRVIALLVFSAIALSGGIGYFSGFRSRQGISERKAAIPSFDGNAQPTSSAPDLVAERHSLYVQLAERDARIKSLSAQILQQSREVSRLRELFEETSANEQRSRSEVIQPRTQMDAVANRDALQAQLKAAQDAQAGLQTQLRQALDQRTSDLTQTTALQRLIDELNASLGDRDNEIEQQKTLLSSDRDIRDLMGARDLYIADVFDIARDGTTKKPFGRVFYTKNKSLVFYAFDLDKQQGLRDVQSVAFQAWGLNDADKKRPLNLGIFYMDNQANRRWVLKFDDPAVLEKINSVFVTIEPWGGSAKPSGKQLLYAFLQAQPNHP